LRAAPGTNRSWVAGKSANRPRGTRSLSPRRCAPSQASSYGFLLTGTMTDGAGITWLERAKSTASRDSPPGRGF
jgi:hypothetical protein